MVQRSSADLGRPFRKAVMGYWMSPIGAKRSSVFIKSSSASLTLAGVSSNLLLMDWADRHCHASHYLMKRRAALYRDGGISRARGAQPLRLAQRQ